MLQLDGKKVLVVGSGISGLGACGLLRKAGACVVIYDGNTELDAEEILAKLEDRSKVEVVLGHLEDRLVDSLALAVVSPGVPLHIPEILKLREKKVKIWGEVELAYQMGKGRVLAITGTNGKTTTTALTGKILEDACPEVYIVGNIGTPYTSRASQMTDRATTVAEISSFQLETIEEFHPSVTAILNITEDHLNRHGSMEEYIRVKEMITANQGQGDVCVLNFEDEVLRDFGLALAGKVKVVWFSSKRELEEGVFLRGKEIVFRENKEEEVLTRTDRLKLVGIHNFENVMAAAAVAKNAGVSLDSIRRSTEEFKAVPHRIEYVEEKAGVVYYNDSKGTNPDAAIKGIQAMERPTFLIGGGYDKQSDYTEWIRAFDGKVKKLLLIGQTREKIRDTALACGFTDIVFCDSLQEAVELCGKEAVAGDAVLLSPACASWGQFDNYEQRGDMFKQYVAEL